MIGFHYPRAFLLFFLFAGMLALYLWSRWKRKRDLQRLGDWRVVRHLIPLNAIERRKTKDLLALIGLFFLLIAITGPQFGSTLKEVKHKGVEVFIAMDVSRSMLAEDVPPSRLEHAKRSLGLLINKLGGNRVGIIAFARRAIIQCPLTVDGDAAQMFLDILDEHAIPEQGTAIGDAIRLALRSFPKEEKSGRAIVLLTDGEDHRSDPMAAAREARDAGVVVFTIGIGTSKGEVIRQRDESGNVTEFLKHKGELVISRMDDALLTKIAEVTGGQYFRASATDQEIDEIAAILNGFEKREFSSRLYDRLQERYQIFALIAFLLLLIEFFLGERTGQLGRVWRTIQTAALDPRRLFRGAAAVLLTVLLAAPAHADVKSSVLRGNRLIKKGDLAGARAEFESAQIDAPEAAFIPYNIGTTHYLEGDFEEAKRNYERAASLAKDPDLQAKIAYNLGHLLFSMGDREGAIESFKQCLKLNSKDMDAKYNIEYVRAGKTPKNPPRQKQKQDKDQPGGKDDKKEPRGDGDSKDKKDGPPQEQPAGGDEEKKNGLTKEDAERVLQMMQDQESEKMKDAQQQRARQAGADDDKRQSGNMEDW